jgi:hypothetical protein
MVASKVEWRTRRYGYTVYRFWTLNGVYLYQVSVRWARGSEIILGVEATIKGNRLIADGDAAIELLQNSMFHVNQA